jgi:predicted branched-subunit amino acid permease
MAGIAIIASGGSIMEMAAAQFVINLRYALMSLSLTQKVDDSFTLLQRMILSFLITDEIFAVSSTKEKWIGTRYFYGLGLLPILGWVLGTALGAFAGMVLPQDLTAALGIMIYGMFLAILIPPAKKRARRARGGRYLRAMSCCSPLHRGPLFSRAASPSSSARLRLRPPPPSEAVEGG